MSKTFRPWNVDQSMLLPPSIGEFVPPNHPAHMIREFVREELDLSDILNEYSEERGCPPYHPVMMVAVLLYALTQGVYSSRKIARACEERLDFKAVGAMNCPDFRTISKFRARHLEALSKLFNQVLTLCKKAGLVSLGHVALDGTKLKANASYYKGKNYKNITEEEAKLGSDIDEWFKKGLEIDAAEDKEFGDDKRGDELPAWITNKEERRKRLKEAREQLEKEDKDAKAKREKEEKEGKKGRAAVKKIEGPKDTQRYNFTDPESAAQRSRQGTIQGYNAQAAVDSKAHIIVANRVASDNTDFDQLVPMLGEIKKNMKVLPKEISMDTGYCSERNLKVLEEEKIRGYVALGKDPAVRKRAITKGSAIERMSIRLKKAGWRSRYRLRKSVVEPIFGIIKQARGFRQFLLRGKVKVNREFALVCTAHNLLRLIKLRA